MFFSLSRRRNIPAASAWASTWAKISSKLQLQRLVSCLLAVGFARVPAKRPVAARRLVMTDFMLTLVWSASWFSLDSCAEMENK